MENAHKQLAWDSLTCLVVDDDKFSRTFIKTALYQIGMKNTREAASAAEAVELLNSFKIDIILLDQQMPGKTGLELARELKNSNNPHLKSLPIIMITVDTKEKTDSRRTQSGHTGISGQTDFPAGSQKKNFKCFRH